MAESFFVEIIENASMLLAMALIYNTFFLREKENSIPYKLFLGLCVGFTGILLMLNAVPLSNGVFFDTRSILISITAAFLGPLPAVVGAGVVILFRLLVGGAGALTGVLVTIASTGLGLLWRYYRLEKLMHNPKRMAWLDLYLFGLLVHVAMLLCMLTLPSGQALPVLRQILLPVLLVYPIGSLLLCVIIYNRLSNLTMEKEIREHDKKILELIEQSPSGIVLTERHRVHFVNSTFLKMTGWTAEEFIKRGFEGITHPDDLEKSLDKFGKLLAGEIDDYEMEKRYLRPDGSFLWGYLAVVALKHNGVRTGQNMCMIKDITDIVKANEEKEKRDEECRRLYQQYHEKQQLLLALLDSIPDLIFYKNTEFEYMGCNRAFEVFAGRSEEEVLGKTDFDLFDRETASRFREMDEKMIARNLPQRNEEQVTYPNGSKIYLDTLKTPYYDAEGNLLGLIGISRDITHRKEREDEIQYLNFHDVLTGLYNRSYFEQARRQLDKEESLPLSVIIGDINGLKLINDAFGHAEGDQLLHRISGILKQNCRPNDIIARTGGDEFTILLPKTDNTEAELIFGKIRKACAGTMIKSGDAEYHTSVALGTATKSSADISFERVMRLAEEHMYRQKLLQQQSLHSSIINSIKRTMFEKSNETEEHAERMAVQARQLGSVLGLGESDLNTLELLATLHDIGKISVDREILMKPEPLNETEWLELKKHPEVGYRITNASPELRHVSKYILYHHEHWDGSGYPHRLRGEKIPLLSRILAVVDAYDAMTQGRPYKKAISPHQAAIELIRYAGRQFDPNIVKVFIEQVLQEEISDDELAAFGPDTFSLNLASDGEHFGR